MTTILIVDDDPNSQRMLSYSLRKAGYDAITTPNGQKGLDAMHQVQIDLAVLDLSMPVMDGLSLLRIIRADTKYTSLPIIILTASGDDQELAAAEQLGIQGFLTKPASSRVLLETVQAALA